MTLPTSGPLSMSQIELEISPTYTGTQIIDLNAPQVRALLQQPAPGSQISISQGRGKAMRQALRPSVYQIDDLGGPTNPEFAFDTTAAMVDETSFGHFYSDQRSGRLVFTGFPALTRYGDLWINCAGMTVSDPNFGETSIWLDYSVDGGDVYYPIASASGCGEISGAHITGFSLQDLSKLRVRFTLDSGDDGNGNAGLIYVNVYDIVFFSY